MTPRWLLIGFACALSCSSSPTYHKPADRHPRVVTTADREHPQPIALEDHRGRVRARALAAGTWWYRAEIPSASGDVADYLSEIEVSIGTSDSRPGLALAVVDDSGAVHAAERTSKYGQRIKFPATAAPPPSLLVRVTTTRAQDFTIDVIRRLQPPPEVPTTPCDPEHIDASNPECKGVYPKCNLNHPDFENPNCCQAETCNLVVGCRARVVHDPGKAKGMSGMAMGTAEGIMRGARGKLFQRGQYVSDILVWHVKAGESLFEIDDPKHVDRTIMLDEKQTWVIVRQPYECRANVRRVDPGPLPPPP